MITLQDHIEELPVAGAARAEFDAAIAARKEHDTATEAHHNGEGR